MSSMHYQDAIRCLNTGGIIAYPTEAVFGLGCDPENETAVRRLLQTKQRPQNKGLLLIACSVTQLEPWVLLTSTQRQQLQSHWPTNTTYLLTASNKVPKWICGEHPKVALRVTTHPIAAALCDQFSGPLVSTSANLAGKIPSHTAEQVRADFGDNIDVIVAGQCGLNSKPSTIIDLESGAIVRA